MLTKENLISTKDEPFATGPQANGIDGLCSAEAGYEETWTLIHKLLKNGGRISIFN